MHTEIFEVRLTCLNSIMSEMTWKTMPFNTIAEPTYKSNFAEKVENFLGKSALNGLKTIVYHQ